jgi:hypothetical protein
VTRSVLITLIGSFIIVGSLAATDARADDVTATVAGGTLKIKGDADGNILTLDDDNLGPGHVRIIGTPTTINGAAGPVTFDNVTAGLQVDLGAGNDAVKLSALVIADKVKIKMGAGDDAVSIPTATFLNALSIDLGAGDNTLLFCGGSVADNLTLKIGAGTGAAHSGSCATATANGNGSIVVMEGVVISNKLSLKGSKKNESIRLLNVTITDNAKLALGGGTDALELCADAIGGTLNVQMGNGSAGITTQATCGGITATGENSLALENGTVGESLVLKMSGSADSANIVANPITASAKIDLGQGNNNLLVTTVIGKLLSIKSGKGDDQIHVQGAAIGESANVKAGAGNNTVDFLAATTIGENLTINTGNGNDTIDVTGATVGHSTTIKHGKGTDTVPP